MWIYFIKDYSIETTSGEIKVYPKGRNMNCLDEEMAMDLIKRGYCIESSSVGPVK